MTAAPDYDLDVLPLRWIHPESGVAINDEDMPPELLPERGERS